MTSHRITARNKLLGQDLDSWPKVDPIGMRPEDARAYKRRYTAIRMYQQGRSQKLILEKTGIDRFSLYRFLDRCITPADDGRIMGFRGLLRFKHVPMVRSDDPKKLYARCAKPGVLLVLFARYPTIRETLWNYAIHGKIEGSKFRELNAPISKIHDLFLALCEKQGIQSPHYPFNSESLGKPAIRRWVVKERALHNREFMAASDPDAPTAAFAPDSPDASAVPAERCYQRVECDGHKIDLHCVVEIPSGTGEGVIRKKVSRLWIIALIEVISRAILGYSFSFGANYSSVDVMRAIRNAMVPWKRRQLTVTTIGYRDGDGLPNGVIDELGYACFDELWIDNTKAHLSRLFFNYLERTIGAVPVLGPIETPNARPFIEGFFGVLEEAGLHWMVGTTGSNKDDPRGREQNKDLGSYLTFSQLFDLIDLTITRINGNPGPDSSISRLEVLRRMAKRRTTIVRRVPVVEREKKFKYDSYEPGKISKDHNTMCVRFAGARYYSDILSSALLLLGRSVVIASDSEDLRRIECTLDDGTSLGTLIVERRWRYTKHSRATRKEIVKLQNSGKRFYGDDLPRAFRRDIEMRAAKSKRFAAKLLRLQAEQDGFGANAQDASGAEPFDVQEYETDTEPFSSAQGCDDVEMQEALDARLKRIGAVYRR